MTSIDGASRKCGRRSGRGFRERAEGQPDAGLCGACGLGLVTSTLGRLRDPPWGYYGPCARCSLRPPPDRRESKRGPELSHWRKLVARAAAGRREARRPASWAGHLRRSGDGRDREARHRVRRFRTSACRRAAPLIFRGAENGHGAPAPPSGPAERWLFDNRIGEEKTARGRILKVFQYDTDSQYTRNIRNIRRKHRCVMR